ncbi:baculoviral IAP repeat-containing protein 7-A-like [Ruditapes philippinarum]|uniref:baculoviral IAP repeat-containing protein 7-A-like n=1 Tax=Ruditapes philippinarum TaxID=129788 RepID=UPI00295B3D77|nr:baculoviral IAP repeat-containing protein 7-A-like [Ruditapes philippinarum]
MSDGTSDVRVSKQNASKPPPSVLGINVEKPKFPQYAVISKRTESFESWPEYLPVKMEDMVEAGLVYTGVGDSVRCYFCGGGLRNWEKGDVPMEEHTKYYPKCPHILLVKGKAYVEKIARGEKPETDCADGNSSISNSADSSYLTDSVAAQSCMDMGYSKEIVKKAIDIFINKHGNDHFKGRDICEIIFDIEENPEKYSPDAAANTEAEETTQINEDDEPLETIETLLGENERLKEQYTCKICLDRRVDVIFLPCGHMVSCPQCAPALTKCPVCRRTINGQLKAFMSVINTRT